MKGHLRRRGAHWVIIIDVGDPGGKRRQKWISFRGSKREAQIRLAEIVASRETLPNTGKLTLGQYLGKWVDEQRVSGLTLERYKFAVRKHLIPGLGHIMLAKLTADHINTYYTKQLKTGRRDGEGGLSPASVRYDHVLLGK